MNKKPLLVLSFGGGQDSAANFEILLSVKKYKDLAKAHHLIVVMADTGDEHDSTYKYVGRFSRRCKKLGIEFHFLKNDRGYHTDSWMSLQQFHERQIEIGKFNINLLNSGSCTDHLKLVPIYKFLDEYINDHYGYGFKKFEGGGCRKKAIEKYGHEFGSLKVIIGFAKGEENRVKSSQKREAQDRKGRIDEKSGKVRKDWRQYVERIYPLVDLGLDRAGAQRIVEESGQEVPYPSNCMRCPYMSKQELLWLSRKSPEKLKEWIHWEALKLKHYKKAKNNSGVFLSDTIEERLARAEKECGHMTDKELDEYKFSHGKCTKGGY